MITLGREAYQTQLRFNKYYRLSTDQKSIFVNNETIILNGSNLRLYCNFKKYRNDKYFLLDNITYLIIIKKG